MKQFRHDDRARSAHAGQIIAEEIDDHQILRPLFRVGAQELRDIAIMLRVGLSLCRTLHRFCRHALVFQREKQFGRKGQIMRVPRIDDTAIARLRAAAQRRI